MLKYLLLSFALFCSQASAATTAHPQWPLPADVKAGKEVVALEMPTTLKPESVSLSNLLSNGGKIISVMMNGPNNLVVTLKKQSTNVICSVHPPNPYTDQNVATSQCFDLN